MKFPLSTLLTLLCMASPLLGVDLPKISALQPNEQVVVDFHSMGCFHRVSYRYVITASNVEIYDLPKDDPAKILDKKGELELSPEDVLGLDLLFEYYEDMPPHRICTTKDNLQIKLMRDDALVEEFEIKDDSCGFDLPDAAVTLQALEYRLRKSTPTAP